MQRWQVIDSWSKGHRKPSIWWNLEHCVSHINELEHCVAQHAVLFFSGHISVVCHGYELTPDQSLTEQIANQSESGKRKHKKAHLLRTRQHQRVLTSMMARSNGDNKASSMYATIGYTQQSQ